MRRLLLAAALFLAAVPVRSDPLLPTAEGTTWEYDSTETLTGAAPVHSNVTVRAGKQILYGTEVIKLETRSGNVVSKIELVIADEEGITRLARAGKDGKLTKLNPPEPMIVAPLKVGSGWESDGEMEGIKMHHRFTVVAEERVTVPAGKFQAFHIRGEGASLMSVILDQWFVPGTGFVKETTVVKGPGLMQRVTLELNKVTISPLAPSPTEQQIESSPKSAATIGTASTPSETDTNPAEKTAAPLKKLSVKISGDPAGEAKTEFKSDTPRIYVLWYGHNLPEGAKVRVAWVAEDVGDLVEPNFIIDETETVAAVPDANARFTLGRPPDGWAEGKYRVEFYVDDLLVETVKVTIR